MGVAACTAAILSGCVTNTDVPQTFAATVTVTGDAESASAETGECTVGGVRVAPGEKVMILGDTGVAFADAVLEATSIEHAPAGPGRCTYVAHFGKIPANQRHYTVWVHGFAEQVVTGGDLDGGAVYHLRPHPPTG